MMQKISVIEITYRLRGSLPQFHFLKNNCALAALEHFKTHNLGKRLNTSVFHRFWVRDLSSRPQFEYMHLGVIFPLQFQFRIIMDNENIL